MKKRIFLGFLVPMVAVAFLAGFSTAALAAKIKIGGIMDTTGATSDVGKDYAIGMEEGDSLIVAELARRAEPLARIAPEDWKVRKGGAGVDVGFIVREGVIGVGHRVDTTHYFDVHHSRADTFEKIDRTDLARNVAAIAGLIYLVAETPADLGPAPVGSLPSGPPSVGGH